MINWTAYDYLLVALLIGAAAAVRWTLRKSPDPAYRAGAGYALIAAILMFGVNGAVGMIGAEDSPWNLMFAGVLAIALGGAAFARFRPGGMARTMKVAAFAHLVASAIGLSVDVRGGLLSAIFAGLWLLSSRSFRRASAGRPAD